MPSRKLILAMILAGFMAVGCAGGCAPAEKKPEEPEAPPPPTAMEIRQDIMAPVMPLVNQYNVPWKDLKDIPQQQMFGAMDQVRVAKQKHASGENAAEGFRLAADAIEQNMRGAYDNEAWVLTAFLWRALNEVSTTRAQNYANLHERARTFIEMPRPSVTGFFQQGDAPVVFMDVYLPKEKRTEKVRVREGEEFNGMKLVEIKGNNRGAIVEHIETGERLDLDYGPTPSR